MLYWWGSSRRLGARLPSPLSQVHPFRLSCFESLSRGFRPASPHPHRLRVIDRPLPSHQQDALSTHFPTLLVSLRRHELPLLMPSLAGETPEAEATRTVVRERSALAYRMIRACVVRLSGFELLTLQIGLAPHAMPPYRRSADVEVLRTRVQAVCDEADRRRVGGIVHVSTAAIERDSRDALQEWKRLGHPDADLVRYLEGLSSSPRPAEEGEASHDVH